MDPFREVTEAAPFSTLRLALLRTSAALTAAIPLTIAVALSVPNLKDYFATWLLPGLTLTVSPLILITWLTAWVACGVTSIGWVAAASVAAGDGTIGAVASTAGQVAFAVALVVLAALFVRAGTIQHTRGGPR